jgi:hypothetical protein
VPNSSIQATTMFREVGGTKACSIVHAWDVIVLQSEIECVVSGC